MASQQSSPEKLKETLASYKFVSPTRRSPRVHPGIKEEFKEENAGGTPLVSFGTSQTLIGLEGLVPIRSASTPSTPRKRKLKGEPDATSSPVKKVKRGYAPPEQYAHLNYLQDYLQEGLDSTCYQYFHGI